MYICICIWMYICIHKCTYTHIFTSIYTYAYIYIYIYTSICVYIYIYIHINTHRCGRVAAHTSGLRLRHRLRHNPLIGFRFLSPRDTRMFPHHRRGSSTPPQVFNASFRPAGTAAGPLLAAFCSSATKAFGNSVALCFSQSLASLCCCEPDIWKAT